MPAKLRGPDEWLKLFEYGERIPWRVTEAYPDLAAKIFAYRIIYEAETVRKHPKQDD